QVKVKAKVGSRAKKPARLESKQKQSPKSPLRNPNDPIDLQSQVFSIIPFTPLREETSEQPTANWVIASTWDGLFYTEDEKKGWKPLRIRPWNEGDPTPPVQPRVNTIATSPKAPGVIYVGAEEGLYVSRDNGKTFLPVPLDEETTRIRSIVFDPRTA